MEKINKLSDINEPVPKTTIEPEPEASEPETESETPPEPDKPITVVVNEGGQVEEDI
jgi:hypothetical protein